MTTAFATAATGYRSLSERIADVGNSLPEAFGSGRVADALDETLTRLRDWTGQTATTADQLADVCDRQAEADALLAAAPTEEEVQAAKDAYADAMKALAAGEIEPEQVDALRDEYNRLKAERDAALKAHAEACGCTKGELPLCEPPCMCGEEHDEEGSSNRGSRKDEPGEGNGVASTSPSPSSGSSDTGGLSDTTAGTSLTSDSAQITGTGQPQMLAQQPMAQAMPQQPAPSGGSAAPAGGMPQGTMLGRTPNPDAKLARGAKDKRDKDGLKPSDLDALLTPVPSFGSNVGAGTGGVPDRGGNSGPVTTDRTISGPGTNQGTALSSNTTPPPGANSQAGQGMRGGMMPMGGMGAGAGMGGANASAVTKPSILSTQPDPIIREQDDQAVQGGTLSRETSDLPSKVEDEERAK